MPDTTRIVSASDAAAPSTSQPPAAPTTCPLRMQTGPDAVREFAAIVAGLPPELRAAFEVERAACRSELEQYLATYGYHT